MGYDGSMAHILSPWKDDWQALARHYRFSGFFGGRLLRFRTAWMGSIAAQPLWVTVGANMEGLYVATALPVIFSRLRYPPLFFPWPDVTITGEDILRSHLLTFHMAQAPGVTFQIEQDLGSRLSRQAGAAWPGEKPSEPAEEQ